MESYYLVLGVKRLYVIRCNAARLCRGEPANFAILFVRVCYISLNK